MTTLFEKLGLTRDSLALAWGKWVGYAISALAILAPMGVDMTQYGIPAHWVKPIQLIALVLLGESAQHRTSDLPSAREKARSDALIKP